MRRLGRFSASLCFIFSCICSAAPGIGDGPTMRLAGNHPFSATGAPGGGTIVWSVDRETRVEAIKARLGTVVEKGVYSARGSSASFNLSKVAGQETTYFIRASDGRFTDTQRVQVFEPDTMTPFVYRSAGNPDLLTYALVPESLNAATRMLVVMHGAGRDTVPYCESWLSWAASHDYVLLCPQFDNKNWTGNQGYNRGAIFRTSKDTSRRGEDSWAFSELQNLQSTTRTALGLQDKRFDLWGHSAGAQFIHRFMLFRPAAPVRLAMPANAGWYILPDKNEVYPCGPVHPELSLSEQELLTWTNRDMVIFRGQLDTGPQDLEKGGCIDAQGATRFARALYFYNKGKAFNADARWQLIDVPGVGHEQSQMAPAAQAFLEQYNATNP